MTDPDGGLRTITWIWERSTNQSNWTSIEGATSRIHTPTTHDVNHYLRATASYTDAESSGQNAEAISANKVEEEPGSNIAPQFPSSETGMRLVAENTPPGHNIGSPVEAEDADNDTLTYSLIGFEASFDIDELTGQLKTRALLDHEDPGGNTLRVIVTATDPSDDDARKVVIINVTGVNEPPEISGDIQNTFDEKDTGIVADYAANDPENSDIEWTLSGLDAPDFNIDDNGDLSFRTPPDFERPAGFAGGQHVSGDCSGL